MGNFNKLTTALVLVVLCTSLVSAFGVNSPYWQENPLKMYPGESREASFNLVNGVDEETAEITIVLIRGSEIAEIKDKTEFTLPPGSNTENVVLTITIPENVPLGQKYEVEFSVRNKPSEEEGNVQLNVGYNVNFPVEIVTQDISSSSTEAPSAAELAAQQNENSGFEEIANQGSGNNENGPCADGSYNCGGGIIKNPATIPIVAILVAITALIVLIVFTRKNKTVK